MSGAFSHRYRRNPTSSPINFGHCYAFPYQTFVMAQNFRRDVNELIASEPTIEEIDDFLGNYEALMSQPVLLH